MQTPIQQEYQTKMQRFARIKKREHRRMERKPMTWPLVMVLLFIALLDALCLAGGEHP